MRSICLSATIAVGSVLLFPLEGYSQDAQQPPVAACQIKGAWTGVGAADANAVFNGADVTFQGKYKWTGSYDADAKQLTVHRTPAADEMDKGVPDWARQKVADKGTAQWRMVLDAKWVLAPGAFDRDKLRLEGKWYSSKITYTEKKDEKTGEILEQTADVDGEEPPKTVTYERTDVAGRVRITVRPPAWPRARMSIDALATTDPFFVDVSVPCDQAEKAGDTVRVDIASEQAGKSTSLDLSKNNSGTSPLVIYSSDSSMTFGAGGGGTAKTFLIFGYDSGGNTGLKTENGDTVTFSYSPADQKVRVYKNVLRREIGRNTEFLRAARDFYSQRLGAAGVPTADLNVINKKLQITKDCLGALDYDESDLSYDVRSAIGYRKASISAACVNMLAQDPSKWNSSPGGQDIGVYVKDAPGFGLNASSSQEAAILNQAIQDSRDNASNAAVRLVTAAGQEAVLTFVRMTGAEAGAMVFFGVDAMGNKVSTTDRILAGVSLASWGTLSVLGPTALAGRLEPGITPGRGYNAFGDEGGAGTTSGVSSGGTGPSFRVSGGTPELGVTSTSNTSGFTGPRPVGGGTITTDTTTGAMPTAPSGGGAASGELVGAGAGRPNSGAASASASAGSGSSGAGGGGPPRPSASGSGEGTNAGSSSGSGGGAPPPNTPSAGGTPGTPVPNPPPFSVDNLVVEGNPADTTAGWLRTSNGDPIQVGSPKARPNEVDPGWPNKVKQEFGAENESVQDRAAQIAQHAEGQAAAVMWRDGVKQAWLDINNNYVCDGCRTYIERMLPPNSTLTVRYQVAPGDVRSVTFHSTKTR